MYFEWVIFEFLLKWVGGEVLEGFKKVVYDMLMLSFVNVFN